MQLGWINTQKVFTINFQNMYKGSNTIGTMGPIAQALFGGIQEVPAVGLASGYPIGCQNLEVEQLDPAVQLEQG
jgi:hypothetical protein